MNHYSKLIGWTMKDILRYLFMKKSMSPKNRPRISRPKHNFKFIMRQIKEIKSKVHNKLGDKLGFKLTTNIQLFKYTANKLKLPSGKAKILWTIVKTSPLMRQMMSNLFLKVKIKRTKQINKIKSLKRIRKITKRKKIRMGTKQPRE